MAEERDADNQTHLTLMSVLLLFWCHILFEIDIFLKITNNSTITKSDEFMERKKLWMILSLKSSLIPILKLIR